MSFVHRRSDQIGPPPDYPQANRRACWQPQTSMTATTRGIKKQRRFIKKTKLEICTYNTRTISDLSIENRDIMIKELENTKWDIIGLSETKVKESMNFKHPSGHYFYTSGNGICRSNGVGFLINKSIIETIQEFNPISDRLATITLQSKHNKVTIIQAYFPTSSSDEDEVDDLYMNIENILNSIPQRNYVFINGDFNARVGGLHQTSPRVVGGFTPDQHDSRGQKLVDFCEQQNLFITNTTFKKRRLCTWTHPKGNKSQIDYTITRQRHRKGIMNSEVLNIPDISDHKLVRTTLKLNFSWYKPKNRNTKLNLEQLNSPNIKTAFQVQLTNRFTPLLEDTSEETTPEDLLKNITSNIKDSAKRTIPKPTKCDPWIRTSTSAAIQSKKEIRKTKGEESTQYKISKAEVKKLVRKEKLAQIDKECEKLSRLPPDKQFYKAMKAIKTNRRTTTWGIKDHTGKLLTDKKEILERWAQFYETLYADPTQQQNEPANKNLLRNIPPILTEETKKKIEHQKDNKSTFDEIYAEFLKAGGDITVKILTKLFNLILETGNIPDQLKQACIVVIYKKGDKMNCNNYRPISLLSNIYKLFISIIADIIKNDLCLPQSQAAYQPGRNTIEQILCIEQLIEKSLEFNKPLHIAFIDFKKAFDSIKLPSLWSLLESTPIDKAYIELLKLTYEGSKAIVKCDLGLSRWIEILRGVKQGDILAPLLFCIVIAAVIYKTEEATKLCTAGEDKYSGYSIGGEVISNLGYADDLAITNSDKQKLQEFLDNFTKYASDVGLQINIKKTKVMTTDKQDTSISNILIDGKHIEQVNEFTYLGHRISNQKNQLTTIKHRIALGWAAFNNKKHILKSPRIPIKVKTKVFNVYILPVLLYGMDCVTWTKLLLNHMEVFQNHAMRFMTGFRLLDRKPIKHLRKLTGLIPMEAHIRSKTLKLFGHTKRNNKGLSKICVEGIVEGVRSRGAPKRRWRDNISEWTQMNWNNINSICNNRNEWRKLSCIDTQSATLRRSEE